VLAQLGCAAMQGGARRAGGPGPTWDEAAAATYRGLADVEPEVTLAGGRWEGAPYVAGGAARPAVTLVQDFVVHGDLDGDGEPEAVVLVAVATGASGERLHVAVLAQRDGALRNVATALLGDRVQVRGIRITPDEPPHLLVDLVRAGPQDAACCPGELATRGWTLAPDDRLAPLPATAPHGRLALAAVSGTEWVLRAWDRDQPAATEPAVTLTVGDQGFAGRAACNTYFAAVAPGDSPGAVVLGPIGTTRMACPAPTMAVERRFLETLRRVQRFGFMAGRLVLTYEGEGGAGTMVLHAAGAGATSSSRPPNP
jgi:heat shock protein HslJ